MKRLINAPKRIILDSGAFAVWNTGKTIDLDAYIEFALQHSHPGVYVVNLDIIPGRPGDIKSLTEDAVEEAAQGGYENWMKMREAGIPNDNLCPVFHQGDDPKWIDRYLNEGCTYLGISPANDRTTEQRIRWLIKDVVPRLCDEKGNPRVRTHGFAVTSYKLMKFWKWHTVDSASWLRQAAVGGVYCPGPRHRVAGFAEQPRTVVFSPSSPSRKERGKHYTTLSPTVRRDVDRYVNEELEMPLGEWELVDEPLPAGEKLGDDQQWIDKKKRTYCNILKPGLTTDYRFRWCANMLWLQQANEDLPTVDHLFFAGGPTKPRIERQLGRRLLSYHDIVTSGASRKLFETHLGMLK